MISISFPNGDKKEFTSPVTGAQIANSISISLAKSAVAIKVNDELWDLSREISDDADITIVTDKDDLGVDILRHDTAHILAQAIKELYPEAKIAIGPTIKGGFYYDIDCNKSFSTDDLGVVEQQMQKIILRDDKISREVWTRDEAIHFFRESGEDYKVEIISAIPKGQNITVYRQGAFVDLCRGPHGLTTGRKKFFKLMKLAGSYWRGDSNNKMLQRIYGTAWATEKDLKDYLHNLAEAEKRDHRKIGQLMDLFHLQEEAPGSIFWHENGWTLYRVLEGYIREKLQKNGYSEVKTPIMLQKKLWEKSGHWDKFREHMFTSDDDDQILAVKPMNCPCHIEIFNRKIRSYKDLPIRMAEFGMCHRNEPSGSLHGLMRVRNFTQDDAHIFCTEEQIADETINFCRLLKEVYKELGFDKIQVKFSDRPVNRAGSDELWDKAEASLKSSLERAEIEYSINKGEGAFYGPKLEFVLKDAIEREWQCGTLQVDFILPERLKANYVGADNTTHNVVMLHRAILGTFERFIGILIEHYAGKFPLWLAPVQVVISTITNEVDVYAESLYKMLQDRNLRVMLDKSNQKINYKVRVHSEKKVPIIWVVGASEMKNNTVSIRRLGLNKVNEIPVNSALDKLTIEINERKF